MSGMSRSVVTNQTPRCVRCRQLPRWCVCAGLATVDCPFPVEVLMHHAEQFKPSSTGHLIQRVVTSARTHIYERNEPLQPERFMQPGKELWILHPKGDALPTDVSPDDVQILLLDGNWGQASEMMQAVGGLGRKINLPMTGASRYWLRAQQGAGLFSTVEALLFLLAAFGLTEAHRQLRLQMELHVYAGLCTRGKKTEAFNYLADSPVRAAFPGIIEKFLVGGQGRT